MSYVSRRTAQIATVTWPSDESAKMFLETVGDGSTVRRYFEVHGYSFEGEIVSTGPAENSPAQAKHTEVIWCKDGSVEGKIDSLFRGAIEMRVMSITNHFSIDDEITISYRIEYRYRILRNIA